jgi:glycosyltransferase involved in cell wall biosynthesis
MRITHLTQVVSGHGGVQRLIHELIRRQVKRGHEVQLLAAGDPDLEGGLELGAEVAVSWFPMTSRVAGRFPYRPGLLQRIRAETRLPGVFHAHQPFSESILLGAATRAPKVLNPYMHVPPGGSRLTAASRAARLRFLGARYPDGLLFLCESERQVYESLAHRRYAHSSVVAPGMPDVDRTIEPFAERGSVVLVVSRLVGYKQIDRVIAGVAATTCAPRLVVVGDGPERSGLEASCRANGLDSSTTLLGSVSDDELARWYRTADVVASLSREESFGLTLLEAASAGASLLVSDIPAHLDALAVLGGDDRHAVVPLDAGPERLGEALDGLLSQERRRLPATLPRTWDDTVDDLDGVYRRVVANYGRFRC